MKGTIRTAVEGINLSLHANHADVLMGECIRTFPTVTFPAMLLLKREEIETLKVSGASVIAALHHGHGQKNRSYQEAPFDLLYSFRGRSEAVDVLTPYEMLLHYTMERILPPEGEAYRLQCTADEVRPTYVAGVHYIAKEGQQRILLPELPALRGLRHRWSWKARPRPDLPTWSFAKVPRPQFSPEENARLLCVYLRPWTLNPVESTKQNPLLSLLGKCYCSGGELTPAWTQLPESADADAVHEPASAAAALALSSNIFSKLPDNSCSNSPSIALKSPSTAANSPALP